MKGGLDRIRASYQVPAKRGGRVEWNVPDGPRLGTITGADGALRVRFDDDPTHVVRLHPKADGLRYI